MAVREPAGSRLVECLAERDSFDRFARGLLLVLPDRAVSAGLLLRHRPARPGPPSGLLDPRLVPALLPRLPLLPGGRSLLRIPPTTGLVSRQRTGPVGVWDPGGRQLVRG